MNEPNAIKSLKSNSLLLFFFLFLLFIRTTSILCRIEVNAPCNTITPCEYYHISHRIMQAQEPEPGLRAAGKYDNDVSVFYICFLLLIIWRGVIISLLYMATKYQKYFHIQKGKYNKPHYIDFISGVPSKTLFHGERSFFCYESVNGSRKIQ